MLLNKSQIFYLIQVKCESVVIVLKNIGHCSMSDVILISHQPLYEIQNVTVALASMRISKRVDFRSIAECTMRNFG